MKNEEDVMLIAGKRNGQEGVLYWKINIDDEGTINDYAIVENMSGFDLVKIVGFLGTKKGLVSQFSHTKYENMKSVKMVIPKEKLKIEL